MLLNQSRKKSPNGTRTLISAMPVQCSTSSAVRPTGGWSLCESMISPQIVDICDQINEVSFDFSVNDQGSSPIKA